VAGLALLVPTYLVFAGEDANYRSGRLNEVWATFFFGLLALSAWLAGLAVRHVRQTRLAAARALEHEQERRRAVLEERARIARELHDIVTHQLSVVVLQASGARARGGDDVLESTMAKIETSGRNALAEMRRMLGVLRASADDASLAPPPGLDDIPALVAGVRDAGLPVDLHMDRTTGVPTSVGLSAYRIVQESLTNTIKHAAASRADVVIRQTSSALEVEVHDDSSTPPGAVTPGHGLTGMRERATMLGGDLIAGWDRSGFLVRAVLPLAVAP
jgi:signal transduction histidine kinase